MTTMRARFLRVLLACAAALLAVGVLIRQQAACQGCEPGEFLYDNPVGCDYNCNVTFAGKLTGLCNTNCEASILEGWCTGTKGNCEFHRDWTVISCFGPPQDTPSPTDTPEPTPTNTPAPTPTPLPPVVDSAVECVVPGAAGWCRGGARLRISAADPQGLPVVVRGEINGSGFECGSECLLDLPEGVGTASFTAYSDSGRTASGSASWKLDSVPPGVSTSLTGGAAGNNGWYVEGPVGLLCQGSDATSGSGLVEYRTDGGGWGTGASADEDGSHLLECRVFDVAGNSSTGGAEVKIDSLSPLTTVGLVDDAWLAGLVAVHGRTEDAGSGLEGIEAAVDDDGWVALGIVGDWSFSWDTRGWADGGHEFAARGEDMAGNVEGAKTVRVRIDNSPPDVSMAASWRLGESGSFRAEDAGSGVGSVRAVFSGGGIQPRAVEYSGVPADIHWDGIDGGGVHVGYGTFQAEVTVCDLLGNCTVVRGEITNPQPPPPTLTRRPPSATPTPTSTLAPTPTVQIKPSATPGPRSSLAIATATVALQPPAPATSVRVWMLWPYAGMVGLVGGIGLAFTMDRRAREMRKIRAAIRSAIARTQEAGQTAGEGGEDDRA